MQFGAAGDVPVPADYNGDGIAEPAFFRPYDNGYAILCIKGTPDVCVHFALPTSLSYPQLVQTSDIPVPADYNGDGKAEAAIYRPGAGVGPGKPGFGVEGMWHIDGMSDVQWGALGDFPVPAD